jgi:phosphoglycerate dehydrogenase-like enzyme
VTKTADPFTVALTWQADPGDLAILKAHLPPDTVVLVPELAPYEDRHVCVLDDLLKIVSDADALMGWVIPDEAIEAAPRVRLVQALHAGVDHVDFERLRRRKILLGNVAGANAVAVAEHAMALLLALAKRVITSHRAAIDSRPLPLWTSGFDCMQLAGRTLTVVGMGAIGSRIVRMARGFDMRVVGVRRNPSGSEPFALTDPDLAVDEFSPSGLGSALNAADADVVAAPLTRETRGMFGIEQFQVMKPESLLVNVSRAELIAERALYKALVSGMIAGFASDVWWSYPRGAVGSYFGYPSLTGVHLLPNVVVTPDRASNAMEVRNEMLRLGAENVAALAAGKPIPLVVDLDEGY